MSVRPLDAGASNDDIGTPMLAHDLESEIARLGKVLRAARGERYSLEALAQRSGVSTGLLSQIERGIGNPSYQTLLKVSAALGLSMSDLLERRATNPFEEFVVRTGSRRRIRWPGAHTIEVLTPQAQRALSVLQTTMPPGAKAENIGDPHFYRGTICTLVVSGTLRVELDGVKHDLQAGDTLTAPAELVGSLWVISDGDCQFLQVLSPGGL